MSYEGLNNEQRRMVQRFGPNLEDYKEESTATNSTGFFISKFRKISL